LNVYPGVYHVDFAFYISATAICQIPSIVFANSDSKARILKFLTQHRVCQPEGMTKDIVGMCREAKRQLGKSSDDPGAGGRQGGEISVNVCNTFLQDLMSEQNAFREDEPGLGKGKRIWGMMSGDSS